MGLAASQGRFLCLTARLNDLVYEGHQISQQRMALAEESSRIAKEYTAAVNNKKMQCTTPAGGVQQLTYDILTNQDPTVGLCMRLVDVNGNVVVPSNEEYLSVTIPAEEEGGEPTVKRFSTAQEFVDEMMIDLDPDKKADYYTMSVEQLMELYTTTYPESNVVLSKTYSYNGKLVQEGETCLIDENCKDPAYLQEMLSSGQWLIQQIVKPATGDEDAEWGDYMWQGSSFITEVYDTSDDAAAEAKYEEAMIELNKKDKLLELRLEDIQTQQQSTEKQIDSIKEVIKNNIEDTYKTFA